MSHAGLVSKIGLNPFSLGALIVAVLIYGEVLDLSDAQALAASAPGTALGGLGVRWAVTKGQAQWSACAALGLNALATFLGLIVLLIWLVERIPAVPY